MAKREAINEAAAMMARRRAKVLGPKRVKAIARMGGKARQAKLRERREAAAKRKEAKR